MTDDELEGLRAAFARSGAEADEVSLLAAQLAVGELAREALELAAAVGHAPARAVLGEVADEPDDLRDRVFALGRFGDPVALRVVAVSGDLLVARRQEGPPTHPMINTVKALIADPSPERLKRARQVWSQVLPYTHGVEWVDIAADLAWQAHWETSLETVELALRAALATWSLGRGDPALARTPQRPL